METINTAFARFEPLVHSIFRVITGLLLFQFGVAKLLKFPPGTMFEIDWEAGGECIPVTLEVVYSRQIAPRLYRTGARVVS